MYYSLELFSIVFVPVIIFSILLVALMSAIKYIDKQHRYKVLKLTQEEVKKVRTELTNLQLAGLHKEEFGNHHKQYKLDLYLLIRSVNELAVGINEGLYDEIYINGYRS